MDEFLRIVNEPLKTILTIRMFMIKMTLTKMDVYQIGHTCNYRRTTGIAEPKRRNQWFNEDCNQAI